MPQDAVRKEPHFAGGLGPCPREVMPAAIVERHRAAARAGLRGAQSCCDDIDGRGIGRRIGSAKLSAGAKAGVRVDIIQLKPICKAAGARRRVPPVDENWIVIPTGLIGNIHPSRHSKVAGRRPGDFCKLRKTHPREVRLSLAVDIGVIEASRLAELPGNGCDIRPGAADLRCGMVCTADVSRCEHASRIGRDVRRIERPVSDWTGKNETGNDQHSAKGKQCQRNAYKPPSKH